MSTEKVERKKKEKEKVLKQAKNRKLMKTLLPIVIAVVVVGGIAAVIAYYNFMFTKQNANYSAELNEDGTIKDVKPADYVTLPDYKNITVSRSELEVSEEDWNSYINQFLVAYGQLSDKEGEVVNNGDKINVDYVGSVDGEEFEGGSTNGSGSDMTLGQGGYIEGFEAQIEGHKVGENFDINVTFPEDYSEESLQGKAAVFNITINGKYVPAEYTDDFVRSYISDDENITAEEYKKQYCDEKFKANFDTFVKNSVFEGSQISSYPEAYLEAKKGLIKFKDYKDMEALNDNYMGYTGSKMYKNIKDYKGLDAKEYEASLTESGKEQVKEALVVQAIFEDAGLENTVDNLNEMLNDEFGVESKYYYSFEQVYGAGYLQQLAMKHAVYKYLDSTIQVTD